MSVVDMPYRPWGVAWAVVGCRTSFTGRHGSLEDAVCQAK